MNNRPVWVALFLLAFLGVILTAGRDDTVTDQDRAQIWCNDHGHYWRSPSPFNRQDAGCFAKLYHDRPIFVDTFSHGDRRVLTGKVNPNWPQP